MCFLNIAQSVDRQTSINLYANPWQGWFSNLDLGFQAGWPSKGLVVVGLIILKGRAAVTNAFGDDQPDHDAATKCKCGE